VITGRAQAKRSKFANRRYLGEQYGYIALDSHTDLLPSFEVRKRNAADCYWLMKDLKFCLATRAQLTTDGFRPYVGAVDAAFGFAMLVKTYSGDEADRERYSPSDIVNAVPIPVMGCMTQRRFTNIKAGRQNDADSTAK
jgi:hypothetical protein